MQDITALIGNTPLVRLRRASEATGCEILGKCEFLNPGGSVKDRPALWMIRDALRRGLVAPGGAVVEGTAGNTGIGLALVAAAFGLKAVIVIPQTQSREKKEALRALAARLVEVPAKPYRDPDNYVHYSARLAEALAERFPGGAFWANQFDNTVNRRSHEESTGPEIWEQTQGRVDAFVAAVGSGGTLAGVARALRRRRKDVVIALADPHGSALHTHYTTGRLEAEGGSVTEGIGQGRITQNLEGLRVDFSLRISDAEALETLFDLTMHEGLCLGGSSGVNVAAAVRLARHLGPGHTIITMLCDSGTRYASKLYNPAFLKDKGLPLPPWAEEEPLPEVFIGEGGGPQP